MQYDTEPCSRCGGSGHYSYNQMTGTRCFKCGGAKTQLTKAGAAAKAYADSILNVAIENLPQNRRAVYIDRLAGRKITFTGWVKDPTPHCHRKDPATGALTPLYGITPLVNGKPINLSLGEGIIVRMKPTPEEEAAIEAVQIAARPKAKATEDFRVIED